MSTTIRSRLERAVAIEPELWRSAHALAADVGAHAGVVREHLRGMVASGLVERRRGTHKWAEYEYRASRELRDRSS